MCHVEIWRVWVAISITEVVMSAMVATSRCRSFSRHRSGYCQSRRINGVVLNEL